MSYLAASNSANDLGLLSLLLLALFLDDAQVAATVGAVVGVGVVGVEVFSDEEVDDENLLSMSWLR